MSKTRVVFRKWKKKAGGEVIALFPDIPAGQSQVSSFMHFGQHGGACYSLVISDSRPATPSEYADLKRELESYPYNYELKVTKRA